MNPDRNQQGLALPGPKLKLLDLLVETDLAPSKAEARRLIAQGGVRLNGERVAEPTCELDPASGREAQLQVGKLKFLKIIFE